MRLKERFSVPERAIRLLFWLFTLCCLIAAACASDRAEMLAGLRRICTQSGQTVKSYFDPSYGGVSGTFLNMAVVGAVCALAYCLPGAKPDGVSVLAYFLTLGFSTWGITALNIWFCFPGVLLYCLFKKQRVGKQANAMLFVSGLAPLLTDLLFRYPFADWHGFTLQGVLLALAVGALIGVLLPAGLAGSSKVLRGFSLYGAAVPIGVTAFFLRSLLYKVLGGYLPDSVGVGLQDSFWMQCHIFLFAVFGLSVVLGLALGGSFRSYWSLLKDSGYSVDYGEAYGVGTAIMNFGIYGLFIVLYYNLIGATFNAATFGCVFCMVCCCFKGSHPRNVWPIMAGYVLASLAAKGLCGLMGTEFSLAIHAQAIVIGLCFANGLSPISGQYGWPFGIVAGAMHYVFVTCVPLLHGAYCLYNGGFTAAFVCLLLVPVLEHHCKTRAERRAPAKRNTK